MHVALLVCALSFAIGVGQRLVQVVLEFVRHSALQMFMQLLKMPFDIRSPVSIAVLTLDATHRVAGLFHGAFDKRRDVHLGEIAGGQAFFKMAMHFCKLSFNVSKLTRSCVLTIGSNAALILDNVPALNLFAYSIGATSRCRSGGGLFLDESAVNRVASTRLGDIPVLGFDDLQHNADFLISESGSPKSFGKAAIAVIDCVNGRQSLRFLGYGGKLRCSFGGNGKRQG